MLVPSGSTSCSVLSNPKARSPKKSSSKLAETPTFSSSSRVYLSTSHPLLFLLPTLSDAHRSGFDTEVGGKGSQLSGGQKRESSVR